MTKIVGNLVDVGLDPVNGTLQVWSGFRPEATSLITPRRRTYDIVAGVIPDGVHAAPGPAVIQVDIGVDGQKQLDVVIPNGPEVTIQDLFLQTYVWEPYILSDVAESLQKAEAAALAAGESATDAWNSKEAAAQSAQEVADAHAHIHLDVDHVNAKVDEADAAASTATDKAVAAGESADAAGLSEANARQDRIAAEAAKTDAQTARDGAETAREGVDEAVIASGTARDEAVDARDRAREAQTGAETERAGAQTARTGAETARTGAETARTGAETAQAAAGTSRDDALEYRNAAEGFRTDTRTARDETLSALTGFDTLYQQRMDAIEGAVTDWNTQFQADVAQFEGIKSEMQDIASSVAIDLSYIDEAIEQMDDALDVVRAHRWVPQGEYDPARAYVAGDVVVYDGGSYYAQVDIPAGTTPPGGNWVTLGQGGITDASELSGKLGPAVDASDATIDLSGDVGIPSELQESALHELLGVLVREIDATVDAPRVQGALTNQVDLTSAMSHYANLDGWDGQTEPPLSEEAAPLSVLLGMGLMAMGQVSYIGDVVALILDGYGNVNASKVVGALTDQVDASAAMVGPTPSNPEPMSAAEWMDALESGIMHAINMVASKSDVGHTHTVPSGLEASGTPSETTYLRGDGSWSTPPNTTYAVPTQAEAEAGTATTGRAFSAQRVRQAANAAIAARRWDGTQAQYDALETKDPNVTYYVVED